MVKIFKTAVFASLFLLLVSTSCGATELVTNGGFETGDLTGWTFTPAVSGSDFLIWVGTGTQNSGTSNAGFGAVDAYDDSILQTLNTVPGQSYNISFWLYHLSTDSANDFSASWNGTTMLSLVNAPSFPYTLYSFNETASASSTVLQFNGRENPSWYYLDDVSVTGVQGVPEPTTMLLLGIGLVGVAGLRRKMHK